MRELAIHGDLFRGGTNQGAGASSGGSESRIGPVDHSAKPLEAAFVGAGRRKPAGEILTVLYPFQIPHLILSRGMIRDDCASDRFFP
jgi:hypothetical protein